jgi:hypothetical protein
MNCTTVTDCLSGGKSGTSIAAPLWAGFTALVNEQAILNGNAGVGFANPALYGIASNPAAYAANFNDIKRGRSSMNEKAKPPVPAAHPFPATDGYDLVTGLGSPTCNLISTLAGGSGWAQSLLNPQPYAATTPTLALQTNSVVPITLAPFWSGSAGVASGGQLYMQALVNNTDTNGDYNLYGAAITGGLTPETSTTDLPAWNSLGDSFTAITFDPMGGLWGITRSFHVWDQELTWTGVPAGTLSHDFDEITSVAAYNATWPNPEGFLLATSATTTCDGGPSGGPSGQCIKVFEPSPPWPTAWPAGTWTNLGWGASQVTADPDLGNAYAVGRAGNVWQLAVNAGGWNATEMPKTACGTGDGLSFAQIAAKYGIVIALANDGTAWWAVSPVVSALVTSDCWTQIDTWASAPMSFVSIATDNSNFDNTETPILAWATDSSGDIWYVNWFEPPLVVPAPPPPVVGPYVPPRCGGFNPSTCR